MQTLANPNRHLFIDDHWIESMAGVRRRAGVPEKLPTPVMRPEHVWEEPVVYANTVCFDDQRGRFEMWYNGYHKRQPDFSREERVIPCYATSLDGTHWEKPTLDLADFRGSTANNIISGGGPGAVLAEPNTGTGVTFRTCRFTGSKARAPDYGIAAGTSTDGLNWTFDEVNRILPEQGDATTLYYDACRQKYVVFTRSHDTIPRSIRGEPFKREIAQSDSDDFVTFSRLRTVLKPEAPDPPDTELYLMVPFDYGDLHLGLLEVFHTDSATIDIQLTCSRDGTNWERALDRSVIIPLGSDGAWDSAMIKPSLNPPIRVGDELWFWYTGLSTPHWQYPMTGAIGVAKLRPDGFACLEAGAAGGTVTIRPVPIGGRQLQVNADAVGGELRAGLLTAQGDPVPGFAIDDCEPLRQDGLDSALRWRGGDTAPSSQADVGIVFAMQRARLYAFEFVE